MTPEAIAAKRREERVKLFASALSTTGVGVFVAGGAAPFFLGRGDAISLGAALVMALALHVAAQLALGYIVRRSTEQTESMDDL